MSAPPPEVLAARRDAREVVSAEEVATAVDRCALALTVALAEANPLLVCVMHGALPFTGALLPRLHFPLELTYVHVGRYGDETRGGETLHWYAHPRASLEGRHVVLVDDILDQGVTLAELKAWALAEGASAVTVVVLVDKAIDGREDRPIQADIAALECEDLFLFGCGMDFKGYWRNLPAIYAIEACS